MAWKRKLVISLIVSASLIVITSLFALDNVFNVENNSHIYPIVAMNATGRINSIPNITWQNRSKVDLFIAVITAPCRLDRRMAIREGYASTINKFPIAFRFFTDGFELEPKVRENLVEERETYKDLECMPTRGGYWFTHRYLHALFWACEHYDFKFFLKTDDDYFLCLNNLNNDLKYRKQEKLLYWGNFRCSSRLVIVDEGFLIVSIDLALEFIRRNQSLYCSPFADQMIAMWINVLEGEGYNVTYFPDNSRLLHYRTQLKHAHPDMCRDILGIHQAYAKYMREYWNVTKDTWFNNYEFKRVARKEYRDYCPVPKIYDWRMLIPFYRQEPKPCWAPGLEWADFKNKMFPGREMESNVQTEKKIAYFWFWFVLCTVFNVIVWTYLLRSFCVPKKRVFFRGGIRALLLI